MLHMHYDAGRTDEHHWLEYKFKPNIGIWVSYLKLCSTFNHKNQFIGFQLPMLALTSFQHIDERWTQKPSSRTLEPTMKPSKEIF